MAACEKCWKEYTRRQQFGEYNLTYSEVVAESDARGGCSKEEQCGELHIPIFSTQENIMLTCRCGKVSKPK